MPTVILKRLVIIFVSCAFLALLGYGLLKQSSTHTIPATKEEPFVNVCNWYGMITQDIINQFEEETGIHVQYDVFDNNEVLEAKLLASNSGYDVVFPTASPYVARQIQVGIYQPLNKDWLPGLHDLNPYILEKMKNIDPNMTYAIPYYWGTLGITLDREKVQALLPSVKLDSYAVIFEPENLKKLQSCGVSFLEEAVDVFPQIQKYLGLDPLSETPEALQKAQQHLIKLRPYIRRFSSSRTMNDLIMGDLCVALACSGESHQARDEMKNLNRTIDYILPSEGTPLWIDCIAIPVGAPHPKNAHAFINFLLRPEIAAKITNNTYIPTFIEKALPFIHESIRSDPTIYPPVDVMKKMYMIESPNTPESLKNDRIRTKIWMTTRLNR